jgi:hypothetical protein
MTFRSDGKMATSMANVRRLPKPVDSAAENSGIALWCRDNARQHPCRFHRQSCNCIDLFRPGESAEKDWCPDAIAFKCWRS